MKRYPYFLMMALVLLFSCEDDPEEHDVKYEFVSNVAAAYKIEYSTTNENSSTENFTGTSWTKSVKMVQNEGFGNPNIAKLTVFPPASWANTSNSANVTLNIYLDGAIHSTKSSVMTASDASLGVWLLDSF